MKICIPVSGTNENPTMDNRFGRASYFCIYETGDDSSVVIQNPAVEARGGAGLKTVEFLVEKQIKAVIVPQLGPNADRALRAAQILIFQGESIPVKNLIVKWRNEDLREI